VLIIFNFSRRKILSSRLWRSSSNRWRSLIDCSPISSYAMLALWYRWSRQRSMNNRSSYAYYFQRLCSERLNADCWIKRM